MCFNSKTTFLISSSEKAAIRKDLSSSTRRLVLRLFLILSRATFVPFLFLTSIFSVEMYIIQRGNHSQLHNTMLLGVCGDRLILVRTLIIAGENFRLIRITFPLTNFYNVKNAATYKHIYLRKNKCMVAPPISLVKAWSNPTENLHMLRLCLLYSLMCLLRIRSAEPRKPAPQAAYRYLR